MTYPSPCGTGRRSPAGNDDPPGQPLGKGRDRSRSGFPMGENVFFFAGTRWLLSKPCGEATVSAMTNARLRRWARPLPGQRITAAWLPARAGGKILTRWVGSNRDPSRGRACEIFGGELS